MIGVYEYATIVAVLMAMCYFKASAKLKISGAMRLSPSLFSIYLLHSQEFGFHDVRYIEEVVLEMGVPMILAYFVTAGIVFCICLIVDLPRRCLCWALRNPIRKWCSWVGSKYDCLINILSEKVVTSLKDV